MRTLAIIGILLVGLGLAAWGAGRFYGGPAEALSVSVLPAVVATAAVEPSNEATIDQALELIRKARDKFKETRDYRCTFLRDELIDGELTSNQINLRVRHEPFSVYMEWVAPSSKRGRRTTYIEGQNGGSMVVKLGFLPAIRLDPQKSIELKESRHTILEAGLRNAIGRVCKGWEERDKPLGRTKVWIEPVKLTLQAGDRVLTHNCNCVTTWHDPKDRKHFTFYRARIYLDEKTGLPVRLETYDWPKNAADKDGQLVERYTYLDLDLNPGLKDADFTF